MEERREEKKEENETDIYPDDIEMIGNPNQWKPSRHQIMIYALRIGFELNIDPIKFLEIAEESLMKPLPNKWRRAFSKHDLDLMYIDLNTNEIHLFTDIDEKAKAKLKEQRKIYYKDKE